MNGAAPCPLASCPPACVAPACPQPRADFRSVCAACAAARSVLRPRTCSVTALVHTALVHRLPSLPPPRPRKREAVAAAERARALSLEAAAWQRQRSRRGSGAAAQRSSGAAQRSSGAAQRSSGAAAAKSRAEGGGRGGRRAVPRVTARGRSRTVEAALRRSRHGSVDVSKALWRSRNGRSQDQDAGASRRSGARCNTGRRRGGSARSACARASPTARA